LNFFEVSNRGHSGFNNSTVVTLLPTSKIMSAALRTDPISTLGFDATSAATAATAATSGSSSRFSG